MNRKVLCIMAVAAGLVWILAPTQSAVAQCGAAPTAGCGAATNQPAACGAAAAVAAPAGPGGKKACGPGCTKPCCAAGPKGATGKKACGPTCTKPCCAGKPVADQAQLTAALEQLAAAEKAIRAGDRQAALAALAKANEIVILERNAADKRVAALANPVCPMSGRPVKPGYTRVYKGRVVGFCGPGCAAHWDKASDAEKAAVAAKAAATKKKGPAGPKGGVVNSRCPIMGGKINPAKLPANLTRTWKGQKVGFCCGGCPMAWDKLTDAQKAAKLDKAK